MKAAITFLIICAVVYFSAKYILNVFDPDEMVEGDKYLPEMT